MIDKEVLTDWLDGRKVAWNDTDHPNKQLQDQVPWTISFPGSHGLTVRAFPLPPTGTSLVFHNGVSVTEEHRKALRKLSSARVREFRFELSRDLASAMVDFSLVVDEDDGSLEGVVSQTEVCEDELTPSRFRSAVKRVSASGLLSILHVRHALGEGL